MWPTVYIVHTLVRYPILLLGEALKDCFCISVLNSVNSFHFNQFRMGTEIVVCTCRGASVSGQKPTRIIYIIVNYYGNTILYYY